MDDKEEYDLNELIDIKRAYDKAWDKWNEKRTEFKKKYGYTISDVV